MTQNMDAGNGLKTDVLYDQLELLLKTLKKLNKHYKVKEEDLWQKSWQ